MEGQGEGEKLWWSEAEITGHDPQDPADDGEGINGVGFLPVSSCRFTHFPCLLRGICFRGTGSEDFWRLLFVSGSDRMAC